MYPDPIHSMDYISIDKVSKSMEILKNNGVTINESTLYFLSKYDLLRDSRPTNAAYLMFKSADSGSTTIELGRFQDHITIKDTARTKSDILTQVNEVLDYVKKTYKPRSHHHRQCSKHSEMAISVGSHSRNCIEHDYSS